MKRRDFLSTAAGAAAFGVVSAVGARAAEAADDRPNILFCLADDWGWPHAGAYGDPVVKTPTFDRLAREGVLFEHAYVAAPSCTPCRNALMAGQWHWRLGQGANLWSTLHPKHPVFPLLLEDAGYTVGHWRKAWGPGNWKALGRQRDPAGPSFKGFEAFLKQRSAGKPFCFWLGTSDPHRPYKWQSGAKSGIDITKIRLPADLPDAEPVRHDVADYYFEVQRWDRDVGKAVRLLEEAGELENTIIVMSGDHGMPFPRHKCNLYDSGTRVPLAIRWGAKVKGGRRVTDFVSFTDLAPTLLGAAGVPVPDAMTGRSLMDVLRSPKSGRVDPSRDHVLTGRERHTPAQKRPETGGYPQRAIRTHNYLYIRNFKPDRWPAGVPEGSTHGNAYADCDGGPTKSFILEHQDDPKVRPFYRLAFARRPAEELYDLEKDPDQLKNVADDEAYAEVRADLARRLVADLKATGDPRALGRGDVFATYPYYGRMKHRPPEWK